MEPRNDAHNLETGRFTVIESYDRDGERYFVVRVNPSAARLTPREREILVHASCGDTNKAIAHNLGLCRSTVRVLMARAAKKLGVRSRTDVVQRFSQWQASQ